MIKVLNWIYSFMAISSPESRLKVSKRLVNRILKRWARKVMMAQRLIKVLVVRRRSSQLKAQRMFRIKTTRMLLSMILWI